MRGLLESVYTREEKVGNFGVNLVLPMQIGVDGNKECREGADIHLDQKMALFGKLYSCQEVPSLHLNSIPDLCDFMRPRLPTLSLLLLSPFITLHVTCI